MGREELRIQRAAQSTRATGKYPCELEKGCGGGFALASERAVCG